MILVLRWRCGPCMPLGLYYQGLTRRSLRQEIPQEPALHPGLRCSATDPSMILTEVAWLPEELTAEEVWCVVGRVAHPELFVVCDKGPTPTLVRCESVLPEIKEREE